MREHDTKKDVDAMANTGPAKIGKFVVKGMQSLGGAPASANKKANGAADKVKKAPGKFTKAARDKLGL